MPNTNLLELKIFYRHPLPYPIIYKYVRGTCLDTQDSRYFELDRVSGSVTVKRAIPEDDLLQPATMVIRVSFRCDRERITCARTLYFVDITGHTVRQRRPLRVGNVDHQPAGHFAS